MQERWYLQSIKPIICGKVGRDDPAWIVSGVELLSCLVDIANRLAVVANKYAETPIHLLRVGDVTRHLFPSPLVRHDRGTK